MCAHGGVARGVVRGGVCLTSHTSHTREILSSHLLPLVWVPSPSTNLRRCPLFPSFAEMRACVLAWELQGWDLRAWRCGCSFTRRQQRSTCYMLFTLLCPSRGWPQAISSLVAAARSSPSPALLPPLPISSRPRSLARSLALCLFVRSSPSLELLLLLPISPSPFTFDCTSQGQLIGTSDGSLRPGKALMI